MASAWGGPETLRAVASGPIGALLRELTDSEPCLFDHRGGCQEHGYLSLKPGERCPQAELRELLAELDGEHHG